MPALRRSPQLKLGLLVVPRTYFSVVLHFSVCRRPLTGVLYGTASNWTFLSNSPAFLRYIPSGRLDKYALWVDKIPPNISTIYNGIFDAAFKAGYSLQEKEEA
jgi:hypothetical protein